MEITCWPYADLNPGGGRRVLGSTRRIDGIRLFDGTDVLSVDKEVELVLLPIDLYVPVA